MTKKTKVVIGALCVIIVGLLTTVIITTSRTASWANVAQTCMEVDQLIQAAYESRGSNIEPFAERISKADFYDLHYRIAIGVDEEKLGESTWRKVNRVTPTKEGFVIEFLCWYQTISPTLFVYDGTEMLITVSELGPNWKITKVGGHFLI